ncbi:MAG: hypothetical protein L6R41_005171 [Letrouitia leprolyta]|nr:MAG: hypothetical protein L6R41_005171 [Letrouitia leprolyta]
MARLAHLPVSDDDEYNGDGAQPSHQRDSRRVTGITSLSPSPAASFSSDKENHTSTTRTSRSVNVKAKSMLPPRTPGLDLDEGGTPRAAKRRKLGERGVPNASQAAHETELEKLGHSQYYDPNQSMEERRAVRKGIRDLSKELIDSRAEFLTPASNGLVRTIEKANEIFTTVRQTSDATLDSRLLVSTADLSAKRTTQLNLGDNTQGIDIDDFVGKCITFMRRGPNDAAEGTHNTSTTTRRRRDSDDEDSFAEQGFDEGDEFDWAWLGSRACFPYNVRPPMPSFLLGPLAVQKKIRKQVQRRERQQKRDPKDAIRPEEIKVRDLEQVENSNLSTLCKNIHTLLREKTWKGQSALNEVNLAEGSEEEYTAVAKRHGLAENGQMSFFPFVINPRSFGQTVENLFYVSFLIRDGDVEVGQDDDTLPTLVPLERKSRDEQAVGAQKHQAVFHLDFEMWEELVEAFQIKESMIPHRESEEQPQVTSSGWYT